VTTQIEVLSLLKGLVHRYRTAALYITHDLAVVAQIADRIMVLRHGKLVESGQTSQILNAPKEDYTRRLIAEREHSLTSTMVHHEAGANLLDVAGVTAGYNGITVLQDVSCTLQQGETLAIVGESGSGKSTLARVIAGLLPPSLGRISFEGKPLPASYKKRTKESLRRIQLIYQLPDVALNPRQTIGEIIGRPLTFYFGLKGQKQREDVAALLEQVGLPAEKQRVCIARALAAKPDLIICDEVTSALDPLVAEEVLLLLRKLQDETKVSYLFITHDLGVVRRLADRTMVMQRGKVIEQGETAAIFEPPYEPYTEQLVSSVPELRQGWLEEVLSRRNSPAH
jgi:peptide/nickel transport system ATP-binding protein